MRTFFISISLIFFMNDISAQAEKDLYRTAADKFEAYYNNGNVDSIFSLFSAEMKKALPGDKSAAFFSGLRSQAGSILQRQFVNYKSNYAIYKTNFERGMFALNISVDNTGRIDGLFIRPFADESVPKMERNTTKLKLPFKDEWTVVWGGDTKESNYHVENPAQKNAFDIIVTDGKGRSYKTDGQTNEDYYAFGKELLAPCDGEVVLAVDGIKDNKPGVMNPIYIPGNTVVIKTDKNEFIFLAHFKQHSIVVKEGQKIRQGQLLGLCGNSGNSSEPHLHFHLQNTDDMTTGMGIKCFFDKLKMNGIIKYDYSPVKGERIKPE